MSSKRAALYVRVSTEEQRKHGLSVDSQISALRQYCADQGYSIAGLYNDAGISARKSYKKRSELLRLMNDCMAGSIDLILFTKLDRWFRSVSDYYEVQKILDEYGIPWRAIWEDYETETSAGVFKVNIMLSVAQSEADRTSERIKAVNEYRRDRGDYIGQAPVGYVLKDRGLYINESEREGVSAFFQAYLDYKPLKECAAAAMEKGVAIRRNTAYHMLASETYAGNAYGYKCEPYISHDDFLRIQARKSEYIRSSPLNENYLFHGLCRCGYCGRKMAASARKRHSQIRGDYTQKVYQCRNTISDFQTQPCPGCGINEDVLEKLVLDQIESAVRDYSAQATIAAASDEKKQYEAKKMQLEAKLRRIAEMYEDGIIERAEYKVKKDSILSELAQLPQPVVLRQIRPFPENWKDAYNEMNPEDRRLFWRRTLQCIRIYKDRKVELVF